MPGPLFCVLPYGGRAMKILIVSGFLGAGKTTFIQTMTRALDRRFVVFENEYGQANLDADALRGDTALDVWELTENCACCTGKSDFVATVLTIANTLDPEYLIVEPTGVARLSSLLAALRRIEYERITLLSPLTVLDAQHHARQREQFPEIYNDQLSAAGTVAFSKAQALSAAEKEALCREVRACNPNAAILTEDCAAQPAAWWESLLATALDPGAFVPGQDASGPPPETISFQDCSLPSPTHLIAFLDVAAAGVFGQVARAKGYLPCGGDWLRFDLVDRAWSITGCAPQQKAQCVVIGRALYREGLHEIFPPPLSLHAPTVRRGRAAGLPRALPGSRAGRTDARKG